MGGNDGPFSGPEALRWMAEGIRAAKGEIDRLVADLAGRGR